MEQRGLTKRQIYRTDQMIISGRAKVLGVIGHPVGHSLSPAMHNAAINALGLDYVYVPFDVPPASLREAIEGIRALGIAGANVTIPHKEAVIPFLDEIDENAGECGSVNTITNVDGRLIGSNTDGPGFMRSLIEAGFAPEGRKAVVLGAGGAGRAVTFALVKAGVRVTLTMASQARIERLVGDVQDRFGVGSVVGEPDASRIGDYLSDVDLLVNSTPVGMHPNEGQSPVPKEFLRHDILIYDLVYNPLKTGLIHEAEEAGARTISGVKMLVYQGAISFKSWTGIDPPVDVMEAAVMERLRGI